MYGSPVGEHEVEVPMGSGGDAGSATLMSDAAP